LAVFEIETLYTLLDVHITTTNTSFNESISRASRPPVAASSRGAVTNAAGDANGARWSWKRPPGNTAISKLVYDFMPASTARTKMAPEPLRKGGSPCFAISTSIPNGAPPRGERHSFFFDNLSRKAGTDVTKKPKVEGSASDLATRELRTLVRKSVDQAGGEQLRELLSRLSPAEEQILRMRFGIGQKKAYTCVEVAHQFDVSLREIKEIETRALMKLARVLGLTM